MLKQEKNNLYLLDEHFLNEMAEQKQRDIYARIISLDINENPIEQIEGKITTGSINIDGSSAVRRTCSLTMVSQKVNITDYYWGIKTKFKLEIGLKNKINKKYPDIIWYPQGIYVITTFNTSLSTNNCTISIQGKDKMCLLNGDVSGQMYASIDFGTEEVIKTEMNTVDFSYAVNSAQIMSQAIQKYYICDFSINDNPISKNNSYPYIFIKENKKNNNGTFYSFDKQNNQYIKNTNGEYKIYKIIENPDEIFIQLIDSEYDYEPNKYYVKSYNKPYYTIDITTGESGQNTDHYQLKNIYNKNDNYTKEKIPIDKIIREAVHTYGKEPYYNIIINDLESYGLEQLTYKGDVTLYALKDLYSEEFTQLVRKGSISSLDTIVQDSKFQFEPKNNEINDNIQPTVIIYQGSKFIKLLSPPASIRPNIYYTVAKFEYGDDIGYRLTNLVYTGDLVSNVGDSLTSILDKIKTMLGDFEYFYDLEGRFVFQRKKTYINVSWNSMIDNNDEKYFTFANDKSKFSFNFEGNRLISAIQNSPKITNLRNDFSVWGKRKNTSGADVNIHMRYAIDKKPVYYKALDGKEYYTNQYTNTDEQYVVDWREIIYQMALDYFAGQGCSSANPVFLSDSDYSLKDPDQFLYEVGQRNPEYYPTGYTGYEQYYTDMQGFWRQLYNPEYIPEAVYQKGSYNNNKNWEDSIIEDYIINYYIDNKEEVQEQLNKIQEQINLNNDLEIKTKYQKLKTKYEKYVLNSSNDNKLYWNTAVFEAPETLNFWIDFLDSNLELSKFSVPQIGDRSKTVKDDKAGAIVYKEIPNLILYEPKYKDSEEESEYKKIIEQRAEIINKSGYRFINLPKGFSQFFTISYRSKSVKDKIDDLLYEHTYAQDNITITSIPIYHLEPNTIIYVKDDNTGINGEYIATRFTIPLNYNGTMSITANKAPQRIY